MQDITNLVRDRLFNLLDNDKMVLPTLPEVALKVRETAADPYVDIPKLANVIANDAALSARMIQVANSPLMRAENRIDDLKMAIMRLGVDRTASLATSIAMKQMYKASSSSVDAQLRANWATSTEVAGHCYAMCKRHTDLQADQATLAGLTHRIGALPILTFAESNKDLIDSDEKLTTVIEELHPQIGHRILDAWDFPDEIKMVPLHFQDGERLTDHVDYADLVFIANQQLNDEQKDKQPLDCASYQRVGILPDNDDDEMNADAKTATLVFS